MSNIVVRELSKQGVLRLTLNDEASCNVLSEAMLDDLTKAINDANRAAGIKVIIIASRGTAFCAGHDLKEITAHRNDQDKGRTFLTKIITKCSQLMQSIVQCSMPVIAEVSGVATAAGCQLVASTDLAYASESAKFATPGVNIGLFCSTPMVALSRNISSKHAMEMLLIGDIILAKKAEQIGLINQVVGKKELTDFVNNMANKIALKSQTAISIGKNAFYKQCDMNLKNAYEYTTEVMIENLLEFDACEGINAFIEKRSPKWRN